LQFAIVASCTGTASGNSKYDNGKQITWRDWESARNAIGFLDNSAVLNYVRPELKAHNGIIEQVPPAATATSLALKASLTYWPQEVRKLLIVPTEPQAICLP
jgi:hypothetical protein